MKEETFLGFIVQNEEASKLTMWAAENTPQRELSEYEHAQHWIKHFCDEVQKRAAKCRETCVHEYRSECIAFGFKELRKELLDEVSDWELLY